MRRLLWLLAAASLAAPQCARAGFTAATGTDTILTPDANGNGMADVDETIDLMSTPARGAATGTFASFAPDGPSDPHISNNDLPLYGYALHGEVTAVNGSRVTYSGTYAVRYFDSGGTVYSVSTGTLLMEAQFSAGGAASLTGHLTQTAGPNGSAFADLGYEGQALFTGTYTPTVAGQGAANKGTIQGTLRALRPRLKLLSAGAPQGGIAAVVVKAFPNSSTSLFSAEVHVRFDPAKASVANVVSSFVPGPGWFTNATNVVGGNEAVWAGSSMDGQTHDGPLVTISVQQKSATWSVMTLTTESGLADQDFTLWNPKTNQDAALINGAVRDLGVPITGSPSTGPGKVLALAAGGQLRLLDAATLVDRAGFTSPSVGPVSARPSFGTWGILPALAVGNDEGDVVICDALTGQAVFRKTLGARVSTPAIQYDTVYAAVTNPTGPAAIVKIVGDTVRSVAQLHGSRVLGAPLSVVGIFTVGTDWGLECYRSDGTPQAGIQDAGGATVAPIVAYGLRGIAANGRSLLFFNAATGSPSLGAVPHTAGELSEAWYDGATGSVIFGGDAGKLLRVDLSTGVPALDTNPITTARLSAEPITIVRVTWAQDVNGVLANTSGAYIPLAGPSTGAVVATGRWPGQDYLIAATTDGIVASLLL